MFSCSRKFECYFVKKIFTEKPQCRCSHIILRNAGGFLLTLNKCRRNILCLVALTYFQVLNICLHLPFRTSAQKLRVVCLKRKQKKEEKRMCG
jgi:hypothetical protein